MAKKSTKQKLTKAQIRQQQLNSEYKRVRDNYLRNIRSLKSRGYDVSDLKIPEIPAKKGKREINEIIKLNDRRYQFATKIELVSKRDITGEWVQVEERVTGKRARRYERKRAGVKGVYTKRDREFKAEKQRSLNRLEREAKEKKEKEYLQYLYDANYIKPVEPDYIDENDDYFIDYVDTGDDFKDYSDVKPKPYYDEVEDKVFDPKTGEFVEPSDIDFEQYSYWEDVETGEVYERPKGAKRPKVEGATFKRVFSQSEQGELAYQRAMDDLSTMEQYKGHPTRKRGSKHDATVHENASGIKAFLQSYHSANPEIVGKVLLNTLWEKDYHSPEYMYRSGGYQAYIAYFMNVVQNLGADVDYESEEDYDEGNYEY